MKFTYEHSETHDERWAFLDEDENLLYYPDESMVYFDSEIAGRITRILFLRRIDIVKLESDIVMDGFLLTDEYGLEEFCKDVGIVIENISAFIG